MSRPHLAKRFNDWGWYALGIMAGAFSQTFDWNWMWMWFLVIGFWVAEGLAE